MRFTMYHLLMKRYASGGYLLLEILIATVIFGFLIASVVPTLGFLLKRVAKTNDDISANLILANGVETTYTVLPRHWGQYPDGTYITSVDTTGSTPVWTLIEGTTDELEAKYSRVITLSSVRRNESTGVMGSGLVDPNSKMITSSVSWKSGTKNQNVSTHLLVVNYER